jgi:hypothetical protein
MDPDPAAIEKLLGRSREAFARGIRLRELVEHLQCGYGVFEEFIAALSEDQWREFVQLFKHAEERYEQNKANEAEQLIERLANDPKLAREVARAHTRWARIK